jgi:hypothetical protein
MEALDRAMLHTIGEETKPAIVRYDMRHSLRVPLTEFYNGSVNR